MAAHDVPDRLTWTVEHLDPAPGDRVLEIGCGRGAAVALMGERLTTGSVTAIDRSATAVEAARRRNAGLVAAGRAEVRQVPLESAGFAEASFDRIFAVNVNLFWTRSPDRELTLLRRWLAPGGLLCLSWEPPRGRPAGEIAAAVTPALTAHGFVPEVRTAVTAAGAELLCVRARLSRTGATPPARTSSAAN